MLVNIDLTPEIENKLMSLANGQVDYLVSKLISYYFSNQSIKDFIFDEREQLLKQLSGVQKEEKSGAPDDRLFNLIDKQLDAIKEISLKALDNRPTTPMTPMTPMTPNPVVNIPHPVPTPSSSIPIPKPTQAPQPQPTPEPEETEPEKDEFEDMLDDIEDEEETEGLTNLVAGGLTSIININKTLSGGE